MPSGRLTDSSLESPSQVNVWIDLHQDDGCSMAPSCLTCPFEACRYDEPRVYGASARERVRRDEEIRRLYAEGHAHRNKAMEVAKQLGVTQRAVYRAIQETA